MTVNKMIKMLQKSARQCIRNHYHSLSQFPFRVFALYTFIQIFFLLFFSDVRSIVPSDQSPYSDVSSLRAPLLDGPPQDCHAMYNPMTHGSGPGQGIGPCLDQYMRHPQAPPPHGMMGHRGMPPTEGESEYLLHLC